MTSWMQFLKVPVNGNEKNFESEIIPAINYLFSIFFKLLLTETNIFTVGRCRDFKDK